jgi:hypothetical protein
VYLLPLSEPTRRDTRGGDCCEPRGQARVKAQELRGRIKRNTACRYGMNALGSAGAPGHGLNQGPTGSACS